MTKLLSKDNVKQVLEMKDDIAILERAFADLAGGAAIMPQRTGIAASGYNGVSLFMPAYLKGMGALGSKMVTVYKDNLAKYGLPSVLGTIILLDEKTGSPLAIMDGGYITAIRTGGSAGLATKFLARGDARVHTMVGSGGMATAHAWAVDCVRDIDRLIVYSLDTREKRETFRTALRELISCEIELTDNLEAAVRQADIVTLITNAGEPIVSGDWFRPGTHINANGAHAPHMRELDTKTVARSKVVCDLLDACRADAGDLIIPANSGDWAWEQAHGSLGDVITGKIPGRESDSEITLFKSVGLAIQDISTAYHVYQKAVEMGIGEEFSFS